MDVEILTTIFEQEKGIDIIYRSSMRHANVFTDVLHFKMNMSTNLGAEEFHALALYENAVRATRVEKLTK